MEALLRPLTATDVDEVVRLSLKAWAPVFASLKQVLGEQVYLRLYPDWLDSQAAAVRDRCLDDKTTVWVAEADRRPVGFCAVTLDHEERTGEIYMIAVDPDHQRQGIASALVDWAVDCIRQAGATLVVIGTGGDPGHAPARRVYARAGFTPLPLVQFYKKV